MAQREEAKSMNAPTENNVTTDIVILKPKDITQIYGLPRITVYNILNKRDCPLITGGTDARGRSTGRHYRVEKSAFEEFLKKKTT